MGDTHQSLRQRHRAVLPSWLALYYDEPIEIASGSGRRVRDGEGREYLDFFAGILTTMLGYDDPAVRAALEKQLGTGVLHTSTLYLIRQQVELAERIAERSGIPDARVFFTSSGTEANEAALLLATQHRRSNQVLAMRNSYHGRAFATVGITGNRGWSASSLSPLQTSYLGGGYWYRNRLRHLPAEEYNAAWAADLREVLATTTSGDVACLIAEPVQGVGGFATPPDGFYGALKEVLDEHGILFVSDEVQTGWGRTGEHFWGYEAHGVVPDALTFAKGLGNGLAIGGVVARAEVMDSLGANSISTFGGNPLATAGAAAVLDQVDALDLQGNAARVGRRLREGLEQLAERHPLVGDVRGKGLMIGVELVEPAAGAGEEGPPAPAPEAAGRVLEAAREHGLLVGKGGLHGNVLRIAPPLTVTEAEADEALTALTAALEEASAPPAPAR